MHQALHRSKIGKVTSTNLEDYDVFNRNEGIGLSSIQVNATSTETEQDKRSGSKQDLGHESENSL